MVIGGSDNKRYPAFNGVFIRVLFSDKQGAYLSGSDVLNKLLAT